MINLGWSQLFSSFRLHAAVEASAGKLRVLSARKSRRKGMDSVVSVEGPSGGITRGTITHLGDAVESLSEAIAEAERRSGASFRSVSLNLTSDSLEMLRVTGMRILRGEGEITAQDVRAVCAGAMRQAVHFEKKVIYWNPVRFVVDEQDEVENPIGVFGRKLEAEILVLLTPAMLVESWRRAALRCHLDPVRFVPRAWSLVCGSLSESPGMGKRVVVDADADFLTLVVCRRGGIEDLLIVNSPEDRTRPADSRVEAFLERHRDTELLPLSMQSQLLPDSQHDGFFYALLRKT